MGASNSKKRLETAERTGILVMQKHVPPFTKIPEQVLQIKVLRFLDLSHNKIASFGHPITPVSKTLISLDLSFNLLTTLDPSIGQCAKLETLDVQENKLVRLPAELGGCKKLKKLNLGSNQLRQLPAEIGGLASLQNLLIPHNKLMTLPSEVGQLQMLQLLDLTANAIEALPESMGSCSRIRWLKIQGNSPSLTLPPSLLRDSPLDRVEVDDHLLGTDGLLKGEGADEYNERRRQLVDKELHAKMAGGDLKFST